MIAQFILSAMLCFVLLYAAATYRQAPIVGLLSILTVLSGLYFIWLPSHATHLASLVGIGRGVDLILYIWVTISLIMLLNLHLKLRAQMELITALARNIAVGEATRPPIGRGAVGRYPPGRGSQALQGLPKERNPGRGEPARSTRRAQNQSA